MSAHRADLTHDGLAGCGTRLRSAREAAGLTVDDVAQRLHMPARVVRSLEAEDWSRLGAPVFVRGQVRSYSRLLGLLTAPMMEALVDVGPVEPSTLVSRTHIPKAQWWAEQIGRRLVYIVLTLSLAIPAWIATRQHLSGVASQTAPLDVPSRPVGSVEPAAAPRTVVASMAPLAAATAPIQTPAATGDIVLRTTGATWLDATAADGRVLVRGLEPAGSERRFSRSDLAHLTIGDASAATLAVDGEAVDVAAVSRANVARFTVSSDGSLVAAD